MVLPLLRLLTGYCLISPWLKHIVADSLSSHPSSADSRTVAAVVENDGHFLVDEDQHHSQLTPVHIESNQTKGVPTLQDGSAFGVEQQLEDPADSLDRETIKRHLQETQRYIDQLTNNRRYVGVSCQNKDPLCAVWSLRGECENNPNFMLDECAPSCHSCPTVQQPRQEEEPKATIQTVNTTFGIAQILDTTIRNEDSIRKKLMETARFVETVDPEKLSLCINEEAFCTVWALVGECVHNKMFMERKCSAACQSCVVVQDSEVPKAIEKRHRGVRRDVQEDLEVLEEFNLQQQAVTGQENAFADMKHPGKDFGVVQLLESPEEPTVSKESVLVRLKETANYMEEVRRSEDEDTNRCLNEDEMCIIWSINECESDFEYMAYHCAPACQTCHLLQDHDDGDDSDEDSEEEEYPVGPGSSFGVAQNVYPEELNLVAKLEEGEAYFHNVVMQQEKYTPVRNICRNKHEDCTIWALESECEENSGYMLKNCPVSCQSCEHLHYETRCTKDPDAVDVWQSGDLDKMFSRIVSEHPNVTVLSRPALLPGDQEETVDYEIGPWTITIDNFITPDECERLIHFGTNEGYARSIGVGDIDEETGEADEEITDTRTSGNAWCEDDCEEDPLVAGVLQRLEKLTGIPTVNSEALQLLKYEVGQFYLTHHDYVEYEQHAHQGPRILTAFLYLNNVEEGGETRFDWFDGEDGEGLFVTPKLGRVILWPSVLDMDPNLIDERTEHEAMPVIAGQKYAANAWFHLRSREKAVALGC